MISTSQSRKSRLTSIPAILLHTPEGDQFTVKVDRHATPNELPTFHELSKRICQVNSYHLLYPNRPTFHQLTASPIYDEGCGNDSDSDEDEDDVEFADKEYLSLLSQLEEISRQVFQPSDIDGDEEAEVSPPSSYTTDSETDVSEVDYTDAGDADDEEDYSSDDTVRAEEYMTSSTDCEDEGDKLTSMGEKSGKMNIEPIFDIESPIMTAPPRLARFQSYSNDADDEGDEESDWA